MGASLGIEAYYADKIYALYAFVRVESLLASNPKTHNKEESR